MWLIPFSYGETHFLNIIFNKTQTIAGLRIWNYNKSPEDSYRGVSNCLFNNPGNMNNKACILNNIILCILTCEAITTYTFHYSESCLW